MAEKEQGQEATQKNPERAKYFQFFFQDIPLSRCSQLMKATSLAKNM